MKFVCRKNIKDDKDCKMTCTLKFHNLFFHARQWCEKEVRGLGTVSCQAGESMHCRLEKFLARFSDKLLGLIQWNSRVLYSLPDEAGDHE